MIDPRDSSGPAIVWGADPGCRIWVGGHAIENRRALERWLADCSRPPTGKIDAAFVAPLSLDEGLYFAHKVKPRLLPNGKLWLVLDEISNAPDRSPTLTMDKIRDGLTRGGFSFAGLVPIGDRLVSLGFQVGVTASGESIR